MLILTPKKQESSDEFNKNLYKLLNNCIYGKSIDNIRKRINVKLSNDKNHIKNLLIRQILYLKKYLIKSFVAVHCSKRVLTFNKPIYVGFCILELSKLLMYQFHYDYIYCLQILTV